MLDRGPRSDRAVDIAANVSRGRRLRPRTPLLVALLSAAFACAPGGDRATGEAGTPLPGLSGSDLSRFHAGRSLFEKVYSPEEGLGPLFNENQCSACHTSPATGGTTGFERVVKATRYMGPGECDLLEREGGENVRTQATPLLRAHGVERQAIPAAATEIGRFTPPFLFGAGLIEQISEESILAAEDPGDADRDGISGRAGRTADGRLARFGRKAEFATIEEFTGKSALRLEMGLTTPAMREETAVNGAPLPPNADPAPDPEVDQRTVDLLTAFVQFLAAPAAAQKRSPARGDTLAAGERAFAELRCSACHTPSMRTGPHDNPALDRKTVDLYSDLLLHDMGPALADVCGRTASPSEVKTELLMGLRHRDRLLHDGRTSDLREAILLHGGEARGPRDAFADLSWLEQEYVLRFLRSL